MCVNAAHTQISDEFKTHIRTTRPELDADLVFANFSSHYPADKRTMAKWRQWVANERTGVKTERMSNGYWSKRFEGYRTVFA